MCYPPRMTRVAATLGDLLVPGSPVAELSERERRFAVAYFELTLETGRDLGSALPAYRRAFPSALADDSSAFRIAESLAKARPVRELVKLLRENYAQRAAMPPDHLVEILERQASAVMTDFCRVDEATGQPILDLRVASPEKMCAIRELTVMERETPDGKLVRKTTLKLHNSQEAIDKLLKVHGLYQDPLERLTLDAVSRAATLMRRRLATQGMLPAPKEDAA